MNLDRGISEARKYQQQGNKSAARNVLRKILAIDKRHEEAWILFSELAESKKDEILCLLNVLKINPANQRADARLVELTQPPISPPVYYPPPEEEEFTPAPERPTAGAGKIKLLQRVLWSIAILLGGAIIVGLLCKAGIFSNPLLSGEKEYVAVNTAPLESPTPRPTNTAYPYGKWKIDSYIDKFTDAEYGNLFLKADNPVTGWLDITTTPELHIECNGPNLYLNFWIGMYPEMIPHNPSQTSVDFRFDSDKSFSEQFSVDNTGEWLLLKNLQRATELIRTMVQHDELLIGFTPLNASFVTTTFSLEGLGATLYLFEEFCSVPLR